MQLTNINSSFMEMLQIAGKKQTPMNCLIVDDDDITRMEVEKLVAKTPFLNLVKNCSDAMEAYNIISRESVDLIFLDVIMPQMSGLDLMKSFYKNQPHVILMTLNKEFALEAFDHDVTDFLIKPISEDRFFKAVAKAKRIFDREHKKEEVQSYIFVKIDSFLVKINTSDILYVGSRGNYITIHTEKDRFFIYGSIKDMAEKLPEKEFVRVHISFIVRLDKITLVDVNNIVIDKKLIPISPSCKEHLYAKLNMI